MNEIKVTVVAERDGELHISNVPCRKGDQVVAVLTLPAADSDAEAEREAARRRFLERADASPFRSTGPYPSRDELHERN